MSSYTIEIEDLHKVFERDSKTVKKGALKHMRSAMRESKSLLRNRTPEVTGELKDSWHYRVSTKGARLYNDAPYAAVVEFGARKHGVSPEGIENITLWAMEKFGYSEKEAKNVAWGFAKRLKEEGQDATYFVRNQTKVLANIVGKWAEKAWEERHNASY